MNPFWRAYFWDGVQPPASNPGCIFPKKRFGGVSSTLKFRKDPNIPRIGDCPWGWLGDSVKRIQGGLNRREWFFSKDHFCSFKEMTSFRFTTLFGGAGRWCNLFFHEEKSIVIFMPFPTAKKKTHTQNNWDPFPSKNQPATTLPCLRGKHQEYQHHHREASESRDLALQAPQGEPRGKNHPGRVEVFFLARPNISTFKGRVFSKIYEVEVEV